MARLPWPAWLALVGVVLLAVARIWIARRHPNSMGGSWVITILVIVLPVLALTGTALVVLLTQLTAPTPQIRLDIVRTALAVGAGTVAVAALVLNGRRQWSTEHDATQRPITEHAATPAPVPNPRSGQDNARQEQQVRLTAQRILSAHLTPRPRRTFWPNIDLDLTGATLVDFDLSHCQIRTAKFGMAKFNGDARFGGAQFDGNASFDHTQFGGNAWFYHTRFGGDASFEHTQFDGEAWFGDAQFSGNLTFEGARLRREPGFTSVRVRVDIQRNDTWPQGYEVLPPKNEAEGRLDASPGRWGYLVPAPAHPQEEAGTP